MIGLDRDHVCRQVTWLGDRPCYRLLAVTRVSVLGGIEGLGVSSGRGVPRVSAACCKYLVVVVGVVTLVNEQHD